MDRTALFDAAEAAAADVDAKAAALQQVKQDQAKVVAAAEAKIASAQRDYDDAYDAGLKARQALEAALADVFPGGNSNRVRIAG